MELTKLNKLFIDNLPLESLISRHDEAPNSEWFKGATGTYWERKLAEEKHLNRMEVGYGS